MVGSDENNPGVIGPANVQGGLGARGIKYAVGMRPNRRALSNIDRNMVAAPHPPAVTKRSSTEKKHAISGKKPVVAHRPVTRNYAAHMANKQRTKPQEVKKQICSYSNPSEPEDINIIDMEKYKETHDCLVPHYVQHTEAIMDEIDQMDEDEMDDADEEPIVDIDSSDKNNPLAVVEYIDDLYIFYRKTESSSCVLPDYMTQQSDINEKMRGILIDWLIEVHYKFELVDETLYLTVNLIDRFLAVKEMEKKKLQLVGITAMLLACKYEEVSVPVVKDLILISDRAYSRKEVLDMEKSMVNTLQFNMSVPTPYVFMRRFLKVAQSDKKLELQSFFIIELCLVEYQMLKFPPSLLAAAAVYTAQCNLYGYQQWSKTCERHTRYTEEQILECSRLMITFHQNADKGRLTGVYRKYSTSKFGYAARTKPASHLLEARF